jgi:hypothetical protein
MTTDVHTLVENIAKAAQLADFQTLRQHWQSLYDTLRAGHPIDDTEAFRLVACLDEAGIFDHLAGDAGADVRSTIDDIVKAAKAGNEDALVGGVDLLKSRLDTTATPLRRDDADRLLQALRDARAFDSIVVIAERLIARGQDHAKLRRIYSQALIDRGQITAGVEVLNAIANSKGAPEDEQREAIGLLGRAYKQLYVNASVIKAPSRSDNLKQAIDYYRRAGKGLDIAQAAWPAINLVAMAKRGQRDGFAVPGQEDATRLAGRIATELAAKAERGDDVWDLATMAEAYVALGDYRKAAEWYGRFSHSPKSSAFHVAGAIRQLEQIWGVTADGSEAGQMLMALKTRLLSMSGGEVVLTRDECKGLLTNSALPGAAVAQSILGREGPVRFEWLALGMQRPPAIARICRNTGLAEGTGFLVDPNQLSTRLAALYPNELLLLTNIHVVSQAPHPSAMTPDEARIYFDYDADQADNARRCATVWESPQNELDAALLSLDPPVRPQEVRPCPLAEDRVFEGLKFRGGADPAQGDRAPPSNVFIMGHPLGQKLCFSLHDTEVLDKGAPQGGRHEYLHYRTPTQKGHSGSPVFDDSDWRVVALHHAGSENGMIRRLTDPTKRHKANEGIAIKAIRREVETAFKNRKR